MAIFDLFSKRQKRLRGEVPDIYTYDKISNHLRVQIVHIIKDTLGELRYGNEDLPGKAYETLYNALCREYGVFYLGDVNIEYVPQALMNFLLKTTETEKAIDVIELCFKYFDRTLRTIYTHYISKVSVRITPDEAIEELNQRFREHGIGYQFDGSEIIKVDSTFVHSEIVKPTINLLWNKKFIGANEEYMKAHEHYRHGRNKECLTECLKAFESTMKIICQEKGWSFQPTDTAKKLIQVCFQNGLVPTFTQNQFTSLQSLLESGIPTIRNKLSGHGQGQVPQQVDDDMTRYGLNLTGTNIIFLVTQSGIV